MTHDRPTCARRPDLPIACLLACMVGWSPATPASAQPAGPDADATAAAQPSKDALGVLLEKLASESFIDRELAAREIEKSPAITLDEIEAALTMQSLDREQRRRLIVAGRRRFFAEPRAAMGIMLGEMANVGLRITGTTPGFDADDHLQAGDLLAEIDGLAIRRPEDLQVAIISRSPGDVVPVVVVRDDATVRVDLQLGAWASLGQRMTPRYEVLEMAWEYRFGPALAVDEPEVIASERPTPTTAVDVRERRPKRSQLVMGGEPRTDAGRAAGLRLDRPLSPAERSNPISYAERVALRLAEIQADMQVTRVRLQRAQERVDLARRQGDNPRRIADGEEIVHQHERTLAAQRADADRLRAELNRVRDP